MTQATIADLTVLIVDDNMAFRQHLEHMLEHFGFRHVDQAMDIPEAWDKLGHTRYDAVFLDLHLPGKSGYNFLQQCREDKRYDDLAIIVISSETNETYIREAIKAGAMAYIVKPVSPVALQTNIERLLKWKQRQSGS